MATKRAAARIRRCIGCGCTEAAACPGGCAWAFGNLCTACVAIAARVMRALNRAGRYLDCANETVAPSTPRRTRLARVGYDKKRVS